MPDPRHAFKKIQIRPFRRVIVHDEQIQPAFNSMGFVQLYLMCVHCSRASALNARAKMQLMNYHEFQHVVMFNLHQRGCRRRHHTANCATLKCPPAECYVIKCMRKIRKRSRWPSRTTIANNALLSLHLGANTT